MKKLPKLTASLSIVASLMLTLTTPALAYDFSIFGNGSDSFNRITTRLERKSRLSQTNYSSVINAISIKSNTGENEVEDSTGGDVSIKSGDIVTLIDIKNYGNTNTIHDNCCDPDHDHDPCPSPTPDPTPTPTPQPCRSEVVYADDVMESDQGTLKTGDPITDPDRTDPSDTLGDPDGDFFSLGKGGSITFYFATPVSGKSKGLDLSFHEVTNDRDTYPEEKAEVEVSYDGSIWYNIGEVSNKDGADGVSYLDFTAATGLDEVHYVRLTDSTDYSLHNDEADGYDLDAVDAHTWVCED